MGTVDITQRKDLGMSTLPSNTDATTTNGVILAGTSATFNVVTVPNDRTLGLWDFLFSIIVDNTSFGVWPDFSQPIGFANGYQNFLYIFPNGPSLSANQRKMTIMHWVDWGESNDITNTRVNHIRVTNTDASDHAYYLYFKAYSFSNVAG